MAKLKDVFDENFRKQVALCTSHADTKNKN